MASKEFNSAGRQAERLDILQAVLEGKSSTTIAKRARSITGFWSACAWCTQRTWTSGALLNRNEEKQCRPLTVIK